MQHLVACDLKCEIERLNNFAVIYWRFCEMIQQHPSYLPQTKPFATSPTDMVRKCITPSETPSEMGRERNHLLQKLEVRPLALERTQCFGGKEMVW